MGELLSDAHNKSRIIKLPCDITDPSALRRTLDSIKLSNQSNCIDDFVNTIGTFVQGRVEDMLDDDSVIADHFNLNCVANINLIRLVLPLLSTSSASASASISRADAADNRDAGRRERKLDGPQILICNASLSLQARSPYALQSATKAGLKFFI